VELRLQARLPDRQAGRQASKGAPSFRRLLSVVEAVAIVDKAKGGIQRACKLCKVSGPAVRADSCLRGPISLRVSEMFRGNSPCSDSSGVKG